MLSPEKVRIYHHPNCSYGATHGPDGDICNCKKVVDYPVFEAQRQEIERLKADVEYERIRLAACSDAALSNTELSPDNQYRSATYADIWQMRRRFESEIKRLQAENARLMTEVREECCRAVCEMCSASTLYDQATRNVYGDYTHYNKQQDMHWICRANKIRQLAKEA